MSSELDLRGLLLDLAATDYELVVIGSSALVMQGWDVAPGDLDLFTTQTAVDGIRAMLGAANDAKWAEDGEARRLECKTEKGDVDLYVEVSGGLTYEVVADHALTVLLGDAGLRIRVGSLEHIRDMRAAVGRSSLPHEAVLPAAKPGAPRVIAIDGPAGAGKSTVSRAVARRLGITYLNTGAMYRCVTLAVLARRADPDDREAIGQIASAAEIEFRNERVFLDGVDVSEEIRTHEVTNATPHIAAYPEVREAMVSRQRLLFAEGRYVAEGRDTGTVVAPEAPLKVYLTASPEERAMRRSKETGESVALVREALENRDRLDAQRKLSALRIAEDAVVLDTTGRSVQDVVDEIGSLARERGVG